MGASYSTKCTFCFKQFYPYSAFADHIDACQKVYNKEQARIKIQEQKDKEYELRPFITAGFTTAQSELLAAIFNERCPRKP